MHIDSDLMIPGKPTINLGVVATLGMLRFDRHGAGVAAGA